MSQTPTTGRRSAGFLDDMPTEAPTGARRRAGRSRSTWGSRITLAIGILLILGGLVGSGIFAWQIFGATVVDPVKSEAAKTDLAQRWSEPELPVDGKEPPSFENPKTIPGTALALIRIPDLGADWVEPVVYGTSDYDLAVGIGWFEATAKPGAIGNFALAGHRGARGPFTKLPDLQPGAKIIVETREAIYTYELDNHPADFVVDKSDTWVLDPVPGKPLETKATQATITLVTCARLWHAPDRAIAQGHLVDTQAKAPQK